MFELPHLSPSANLRYCFRKFSRNSLPGSLRAGPPSVSHLARDWRDQCRFSCGGTPSCAARQRAEEDVPRGDTPSHGSVRRPRDACFRGDDPFLPPPTDTFESALSRTRCCSCIRLLLRPGFSCLLLGLTLNSNPTTLRARASSCSVNLDSRVLGQGVRPQARATRRESLFRRPHIIVDALLGLLSSGSETDGTRCRMDRSASAADVVVSFCRDPSFRARLARTPPSADVSPSPTTQDAR